MLSGTEGSSIRRVGDRAGSSREVLGGVRLLCQRLPALRAAKLCSPLKPGLLAWPIPSGAGKCLPCPSSSSSN